MRFDLKVYRREQGVATLTLEAPDAAEAAKQAEAEGYRVLSAAARHTLPSLRRGNRFPLAFFSQELLSLLEAGISLLEALETLRSKERVPEAVRVIAEIVRLLREGQPLSRAMEQIPQAFPALFTATVRAAERTGDLKEALKRYLAYHAQMETIRKKIAASALYPALLLGVGGLVILFLLTYVVPRFARVYEDLGENVPLLSRALIAWGRLFADHWAGATAFTVAAGGLLAYWVTREKTRVWIAERLWRVPAAGERLRVYQLARFYRTVGMLVRGGIPVVTALEMASGLLGAVLRPGLARAAVAVREGRTVSDALEGEGLATTVASRMLRVGERSGSLGEMMERTAAFHDEETARWVETFTRLFEPLLMAAIGLVIGLIVVLMYLPIFELAGSIQ